MRHAKNNRGQSYKAESYFYCREYDYSPVFHKINFIDVTYFIF